MKVNIGKTIVMKINDRAIMKVKTKKRKKEVDE